MCLFVSTEYTNVTDGQTDTTWWQCAYYLSLIARQKALAAENSGLHWQLCLPLIELSQRGGYETSLKDGARCSYRRYAAPTWRPWNSRLSRTRNGTTGIAGQVGQWRTAELAGATERVGRIDAISFARSPSISVSYYLLWGLLRSLHVLPLVTSLDQVPLYTMALWHCAACICL